MEKFFAELIAMRLVVARLLANQAHASGDVEKYLNDQLTQIREDLSQVKIGVSSAEQAEDIRKEAHKCLDSIFHNMHFTPK